MWIKTKIVKIISKTKEDYKYFRGFDFKHELKGIRWWVEILCENGKNYKLQFSDGRKANSLYEGKEIWGRESRMAMGGLEYWWISKKEFENRIRIIIKREEEYFEFAKKEIPRLQSLL